VPAFNVRAGLHVEEVEGALLVLDPTSSTVLELTGDQAAAFRLAQAGTDLVPDHLTTDMAGLVELGLVTAAGWNRRRVLLAGGAAAAAAMVAVALPSPVAAQSAPGGGGGGPVGLTVPAAPTVTDYEYRLSDGGEDYFYVFASSNGDGGSPIFLFNVYRVRGASPIGTANSRLTVALVPGEQIQVTAVNALGEGPRSAPSTVPQIP